MVVSSGVPPRRVERQREVKVPLKPYSCLAATATVVIALLLAFMQEILRIPLGVWWSNVVTLAFAGLAGVGLAGAVVGDIQGVPASLARYGRRLVWAPRRAMGVTPASVGDHRQRRIREQAIMEERERIAREMHDSLAQVLGYINVKAEVARELVRGGQAEQATTQLEQLVQVAHTACGDVREEILALRATPRPDESMLEILYSYLERWQQLTGVETELEISEGQTALPLARDARLQLFRIIQSALSNVRKHAAAERVRIRISSGPEWLETTVEDDGLGFDAVREGAETMPRFGLAMMRERAETLGGELEVSSAPGQGTRVMARLPIDEGRKERRMQ